MVSRPTRYHKVNARSRTEARWAVFFDVLRIPYIYEAEDTYLAALQKRYLPDFYLTAPSPVGRVVAEIKGAKPTELEQEKCYQLCHENGLPVLLINGSPYFQDYNIELFHAEYDMLQCKICGRAMFLDEVKCQDCGNNNPEMVDYHWNSKVIRTQQVEFNQYNLNQDEYLIGAGSLPIAYSYLGNLLRFAFALASHARFEFLDLWKFKYDSPAINPAFQTQEWGEDELLYNCLEGFVPLARLQHNIKRLGANRAIDNYVALYELYYYALSRGDVSFCAKSWGRFSEIAYADSDYWSNVDHFQPGEIDQIVKKSASILEIMARGMGRLVDDLPIMPEDDNQIRYLVLQFMKFFIYFECTYGDLVDFLMPLIGWKNGSRLG